MSERDEVWPIARLAADALLLDLVDVQWKGSGARSLLRVVVDRKGGVDLAQCRDFSQQLSVALDAAEAAGSLRLPGGYRLEVTSPGTDHPLKDQRAFARVEGRMVRIMWNGAAEVHGTVISAEEEAVQVMTDEGAVHVPYARIVKATQRLPW